MKVLLAFLILTSPALAQTAAEVDGWLRQLREAETLVTQVSARIDDLQLSLAAAEDELESAEEALSKLRAGLSDHPSVYSPPPMTSEPVDMRPIAYFYTPATWFCPPCQNWINNQESLPVRLEIVKTDTPPTGNQFPVVKFEKNGRWFYWRGSLNGFVQHYGQP